MNYLGYNKDNFVEGDSGIDNGTLRINDYILPSVAGASGDVLTMDANGQNTSFQPPSGGIGSARVVQNLFQMGEPYLGQYLTTPGTLLYVPLSSNGSDFINRDDIAVGGVVRFRCKGSFSCTGTPPGGANGQFVINLGVLNNVSGGSQFYSSYVLIEEVPSPYPPLPVTEEIGLGSFEIEINIVKLDAFNNCQVSVLCRADTFLPPAGSTQYVGKPIDLPIFVTDAPPFVTANRVPTTSNSLGGSAFYQQLPATPFQVSVGFINLSFPTFDLRPITTEYTIDLMNPTTEVLATTTAPATDHNTLANLNVGDPHQLYAYLGGRSGGQVLSGGITPAHFLTLKSHNVGLDNIVIRDLNTEFKKNLDIGTNSIIDGSNNIIDFVGGDMNLVNTSITNRIALGSQNEIDILATNQIKLAVPNVSNNVVITSTDTSINQDLNMNNNNITNGNQITCNTINPVGTITTLTSDAIQINTGSAFNRINSDGTLILSGGGLAQPDHIVLDGTQVNISLPMNVFQPSNYFNNPIIGVGSINGFTPSGGVFAGTADSLTLTASTAEQSILPTAFVGTLSVPPNAFQIGDSFHCVLAGDFGSNNGDTLTIRLKGGPTSTTILATLVVPLNNSSVSSFEAEIDFQLRNIGGPTVADICSNFDFTYNQSGGGGAFVGERGVFQNNTTFDTTVLNTLEITAQFSSVNVANSIKTVISKLSKDY